MSRSLRTAIALLLCIAPVKASAQGVDTSRCSYRTCAVRLEPGWGGTRLLQGVQAERVGGLGFFRSNVSALASSDSSRAYVAKFRSAHRTSRVLGFIGFVGYLGAAVGVQNGEWTDPLPAASAIIGVVALYASIPYTLSAHRSLARAIWWHNAAFGRD